MATKFAEIDNAYNNFQDMFPIEEELVMTKFTRDCQKLGDIEISSEFPTISLPPIDIEEAKRKARKDATTTKSYQAKVKKKGFWSGVKRFLVKEAMIMKLDTMMKLTTRKNWLTIRVL